VILPAITSTAIFIEVVVIFFFDSSTPSFAG
jgi:hypothetical protein